MKFNRYFIGLLLIVSLTIAGCSNATPTSQPDDNDLGLLNVVVSILPQADLVKMVGGERVEVTVMIPPGASPDSFEPTPGDLKILSSADLYIKIGHLPFEDAWMDRILAANKDLIMIDSSAGIDIIDNNPHTWLAPRLAMLQVETICQALIAADTANEDYYQTNLKQTINKLENMDKQIKQELANVPNRTFLVYHPAWGYFARDYGLIEMAFEEEGKEPGPADMANIIAQAKKHNIKTIFASPQHSTRSAEAIAAELEAQVVLIDPLPAQYEDIVRSAHLIGQALGGSNE